MITIPLNTDNSPEAVIELLFKLKIKDVMTHDVITATPKDSLRKIQLIMKDKGFTGVPITDGKILLGIISMDDIVKAFDKNWIDDECNLHMTKNIIVLQDNMPISFAVTYFNKYKFGRFPVLNTENELVGIVTTTDVISALLVAMNNEVERLEKETHDALLSPKNEELSKLLNKAKALKQQPNRVIEFPVESFNFETAGQASTEVKKILKNMGVDPSIARRIGIASYELEINQVVHSEGGLMRYYITPDKLEIEAVDKGPGIADLDKALTEGFSTATDRVRALGFGAGMGLPNTKRVSDTFNIKSKLGEGTTVRVSFDLKV